MERELCAAVVAQDVDAFVGLCEREEAHSTIVYVVRTWPVGAVAQLMTLLRAAWPALRCRPAPIHMKAQKHYPQWDAIFGAFQRDWRPATSVADVYACALCDALGLLTVCSTYDDHSVQTDDGSELDAFLHMWAYKVALLLEYVPIIEHSSHSAWLVANILTTELDNHVFVHNHAFAYNPAVATETARVIGHMIGALHEAFTLEEEVFSVIQFNLYLRLAMVDIVRAESDTAVHAAFLAAVFQHPMFVCHWCQTSLRVSLQVGRVDELQSAARRTDIVRYTALLPTLCGHVRDGAWQRRVDAAAAWRRMRSLV